MAVIDFVYAGSGQTIKYGGATILVNGGTRTYYRDGLVTVVPPSGSNAYFDRLDNRYLYDPSGWNA